MRRPQDADDTFCTDLKGVLVQWPNGASEFWDNVRSDRAAALTP